MSGKTVWIEGEGRLQKIKINKIMLEHREVVQKSMAIAMNNTRIRAEAHVLPKTISPNNKYKQYNPYALRALQPPTPGRLTSRTGKLKYMLKHMTSQSDPTRGWKHFGNRKLAKQSSVAFDSQVKQERLSGKVDRYVGTIRVNVKGNGILFSKYGGAPRESLKTLAVRFNWETGIRGSVRGIFKPVERKSEFNMMQQMQRKDIAMRGVI